MKVKALWKSAMSFVDKNLPTILSGIAVVGLGTSVALAIKETPKAMDALTDAKIDKVEESAERAYYSDKEGNLDIDKVRDGVKLTLWEDFKTLAPIYWPTATSTLLTGACIIAADRTHNKRYLAVAAALSLRDKDFSEYKAKVKEMFGAKKEDEVHHELAKDYAMSVPQDDGTIILTTHGLELFYEPITNTYFRSSPIAVERGIREFYAYYNRERVGSVEDLLNMLNVDLEDGYIARRFEWSEDGDRWSSPQIDIDYSGTNTRTGEVVHVLKYGGDGPKWTGG